jgi:hypothetical protein
MTYHEIPSLLSTVYPLWKNSGSVTRLNLLGKGKATLAKKVCAALNTALLVRYAVSCGRNTTHPQFTDKPYD